jgi:hypothetical protein
MRPSKCIRLYTIGEHKHAYALALIPATACTCIGLPHHLPHKSATGLTVQQASHVHVHPFSGCIKASLSSWLCSVYRDCPTDARPGAKQKTATQSCKQAQSHSSQTSS